MLRMKAAAGSHSKRRKYRYQEDEVNRVRNADAKQNPAPYPYEMDIRLSFDQRIQEEVLCSLLEDMRLTLQTNYPIMQIRIIGDDAVCPTKLSSEGNEHREQVVPT